MALVYLVTNTANGKRYVGKTRSTLKARWYNHTKDARNGSAYAIHRAIRKYGQTAFIIEVVSEHATEEDALGAERECILALGTMKPSVGYNMCEGGRGAVGYLHTAESVKRMREIAIAKGRKPSAAALKASADLRRGTQHTDETKAKMRSSQGARRAVPVTDEFRARMSAVAQEYARNVRTGSKHSEETRRQMAASQRARRAREKDA